MLSAGAGIAGGIVLGRKAMQKSRSALGVPLPSRRVDFRRLAEQVGEAGRQFNHLAQEIRTVREKAEQVGRVIS
ncbi:MAG TPA: hypothetical protein VFN55_01610 [Solirubrobacteraceae bacterium]|nr:hypothetical protein [Solirubrobacteraceae bacterium]